MAWKVFHFFCKLEIHCNAFWSLVIFRTLLINCKVYCNGFWFNSIIISGIWWHIWAYLKLCIWHFSCIGNIGEKMGLYVAWLFQVCQIYVACCDLWLASSKYYEGSLWCLIFHVNNLEEIDSIHMWPEPDNSASTIR